MVLYVRGLWVYGKAIYPLFLTKKYMNFLRLRWGQGSSIYPLRSGI